MKKRIITCLLVLASVLVITSCGNKTTAQEPEQNNAPASEPTVNETTKETETTKTETEKSKDKETATEENAEPITIVENKVGFAKFEEELDNKGIAYEKTIMSADMIGAVEGYAYKIEETKVELYRFDTESAAYKNAESTSKVVLESFNLEIDILLNGEYGIINATPEALEIFNNL